MCFVSGLFEFINGAPTSFHAAKSVADMLREAGYAELSVATVLEDGRGYYTKRAGSLIAFVYRVDAESFAITASHSDSPAFKLVMKPDSHTGAYSRISVERYGGAINYTWLDRPLSVAGRLVISDNGVIRERLVDVGEDIAVIPSVAPHLNRGVNDSFSPNAAVDLQPLYALGSSGDILSRVAAVAGVCESDIISHDLYLYCREGARLIGESGEMILSPRIDDLASVYTATLAFIEAEKSTAIPVLAVFDNEEIGSSTKEGAASGLLGEILSLLTPDNEKRRRMLSSSLMLSVDGAHALHPNHPELSNPECHAVMGNGIAVKYNAARRYATDAVSDALLRGIASKVGIALQSYANRADQPGGSTLGSIAATALSVHTVDIGISQLAMHSAVELAAASDIESCYRLLLAFYSCSVECRDGGYSIK